MFLFRVRSAITIGAGDIGAPIVLANCREDGRVLCATTFKEDNFFSYYQPDTIPATSKVPFAFSTI
jgi:hypothetical protein